MAHLNGEAQAFQQEKEQALKTEIVVDDLGYEFATICKPYRNAMDSALKVAKFGHTGDGITATGILSNLGYMSCYINAACSNTHTEQFIESVHKVCPNYEVTLATFMATLFQRPVETLKHKHVGIID